MLNCAPVLLGDVQGDHGHRVLAQHRPSPDVGELERVELLVSVWGARPLVGLQALHLQPRRELRHAVLARVEEHGRRQRQTDKGQGCGVRYFTELLDRVILSKFQATSHRILKIIWLRYWLHFL